MGTDRIIEIAGRFLEHKEGGYGINYQVNCIRNYGGSPSDLIEKVGLHITPLDYVKGAMTVGKFLELIETVNEISKSDDVVEVDNSTGDVIILKDGKIVETLADRCDIGGNRLYNTTFDRSRILIHSAMGVSKERINEILGPHSLFDKEKFPDTLTRLSEVCESDNELALFMFIIGRVYERRVNGDNRGVSF